MIGKISKVFFTAIKSESLGVKWRGAPHKKKVKKKIKKSKIKNKKKKLKKKIKKVKKKD